jgi:hypothetical protein
MACNSCETGFQSIMSLVLTIQRSGNTARLYLQNAGRNIVLIRRILLCRTDSGSTLTLFLRPPPDAITWTYPSGFLEPGISALYYTMNNVSAGSLVQAQAEYVEIDCRSRSCAESF